MDRDVIAGRWNQVKGQIKQTWGRLTDDDLAEAEGNTEILIGKIQEKYGGTREDIRRRLDEMMR